MVNKPVSKTMTILVALRLVTGSSKYSLNYRVIEK